GFGTTVLPNGNYVVRSSAWNGNRGAVTWGDGTSGVNGQISETNSLVGSSANDFVGRDGITVLSNNNYVVRSSSWNSNSGAVTWGDGTFGTRGVVSDANSLVGGNPNDRVGASIFSSANPVTPLANGNYVVRIPTWNGNRGAVAWGD